MAEGFLRARLSVDVQSAGTLGIFGSPAAENAVAVMKEKNIDISSHRSQGTTQKLISESDLILVMADEHLTYLSENFPEQRENIFLLRKFGRGRESLESTSIPDPIGLGYEDYRKIRDMIEVEIDRITPLLRGFMRSETSEDA
jgi:protein-tyrosine-phosphatase